MLVERYKIMRRRTRTYRRTRTRTYRRTRTRTYRRRRKNISTAPRALFAIGESIIFEGSFKV